MSCKMSLISSFIFTTRLRSERSPDPINFLFSFTYARTSSPTTCITLAVRVCMFVCVLVHLLTVIIIPLGELDHLWCIARCASLTLAVWRVRWRGEWCGRAYLRLSVSLSLSLVRERRPLATEQTSSLCPCALESPLVLTEERVQEKERRRGPFRGKVCAFHRNIQPSVRLHVYFEPDSSLPATRWPITHPLDRWTMQPRKSPALLAKGRPLLHHWRSIFMSR